jgi:hypothetical protein
LPEVSEKKAPGGFLPGACRVLRRKCVQCGLPRPVRAAVTLSGFLFLLPFGRVLPWLPRKIFPRRVRASPLPIISSWRPVSLIPLIVVAL